MSLEAAAEQLQMLKKLDKNKQETKSRKSQQEDIVYHQWATFRVDNELYGIDVMQVKEVLRYSEITPVPGADVSVLGIINLRGNVVTVIDTRQMFRMPRAQPDDETRIIVVEFNESEVIGLVVDSVDEVLNLPQNEVDRAPNASGDESSKRFVQGVCYHNGLLIILLDLSKMLLTITPATDDEMIGTHI
ncbi:Positive regulator of CheA protein activity (CheW) [Marinobacterium lacunae]|uniref:Positive regulator of CheA protein activity (CheW) n=1 Tax=Marinobacterium lacunae TaxID=1232683 RepID=A0A081FTN1_9GAMM|nr:Positive regulator of CheA protein activity (CheW) [Marinobacterium lacunae]